VPFLRKRGVRGKRQGKDNLEKEGGLGRRCLSLIKSFYQLVKEELLKKQKGGLRVGVEWGIGTLGGIIKSGVGGGEKKGKGKKNQGKRGRRAPTSLAN